MYDFKSVEEDVLKYWADTQIYPKIKKRNAKGKKFYFLQGPPYTSGALHLGHAWNSSMKDMVLRYKRMHGFDVWDRGGFDMHGLPTERKVMEEFMFDRKEEIIAYGVDKFARRCLAFSTEKAAAMNKDLWRIGVWFDHEHAYMPVNNSYIESVWWLIKRAHEQKRLYEGLRTLSWCATCQTAMAKHECEYQQVTDSSVFLKLKVHGKDNEYLCVWTTTPWTIAYNMGVMVHPELEYVRAKVDHEIWIVSKGLASAFIQGLLGKKLVVLEEFKGEKLKGLAYDHFWEKDIPDFAKFKKSHPKTHTVVLSEEYVSLKAGTGLVHMAGGCGPEDYEVSHRNNIPPFNNLNDDGTFPKTMGRFVGWKAKVDDKKFIEAMEGAGALIEVVPVEHEYAHCERCHNPVVFKTTTQWFFKVEDLKEKMLKENAKVLWVPDAGKNAFDSWLAHLRDNSITKQRFWGTPAPIWRCEKCSEYTVVGSIAELQKLAGKLPENLHKPWIDTVTWKCSCGGTRKRIPDILDVWIDAGSASWACLDYPAREDLLKKYFPADFILEGKDQIRGWYNLLMVASTLGFGKNCFKTVYMHGMLTDVYGVKMSKSLGNVISPYELIDKYGADTLRFYSTATPAGEDINFSWDEVKLRYKNLSILWNVHKYLIDYAKTYDIVPKLPTIGKCGPEEKYIFSRLHSTIRDVTELMEQYRLDLIPAKIETLYLELSRTYIQLTREKVADEPEVVLGAIHEVLFQMLKMLSILGPFISEKIYLNLKGAFGHKEESIHLFDWPKFNPKLIDEKLEADVQAVQDVLAAGLAAREKANVGVRWPLSRVTVVSADKDIVRAVKGLEDLLLTQLNVKSVEIVPKLKAGKVTVEINRNALGKEFKQDSVDIIKKLDDRALKQLVDKGTLKFGKFTVAMHHVIVKEELPKRLVGSSFSKGVVYLDTDVTPALEAEGYARELVRRIQQMRKDAGMEKRQSITLHIFSEYSLKDHAKDIQTRVGAKTLTFEKNMFTGGDEFHIKKHAFFVRFERL